MKPLAIGDFVDFIDRAIPAPKPQPKRWYLIRTRPNLELSIAKKLDEHGVAVYVPREQRKIRTNFNRHKVRDVSIFSGIIFIPDFEADLDRLKSLVDGIIGYIKFGYSPAIALPETMNDIKNLEAILNVAPSRRHAVGDLVRIVDGPFAYWIGRIERLDSKGRLKVLLDFIERKVPIEIGEDEIEAV